MGRRRLFGSQRKPHAVHLGDPKTRTSCNRTGFFVLVTDDRTKVTCLVCLRFLGINLMKPRVRKATGRKFKESSGGFHD